MANFRKTTPLRSGFRHPDGSSLKISLLSLQLKSLILGAVWKESYIIIHVGGRGGRRRLGVGAPYWHCHCLGLSPGSSNEKRALGRPLHRMCPNSPRKIQTTLEDLDVY